MAAALASHWRFCLWQTTTVSDLTSAAPAVFNQAAAAAHHSEGRLGRISGLADGHSVRCFCPTPAEVSFGLLIDWLHSSGVCGKFRNMVILIGVQVVCEPVGESPNGSDPLLRQKISGQRQYCDHRGEAGKVPVPLPTRQNFGQPRRCHRQIP